MSNVSRRAFLAIAGGSILAPRWSSAQESKPAINTAPRIQPGAWPVMYTPFTTSREVDYAAVEELVEFYIGAGVGGIFAAAFSGEVFQLSADEAVEIARHALRKADGRTGVVVGGNFGSTLDEQAANLQRIQDLGADAAVIVLSKLPSPDDIEGQLIKLMDQTRGPLGLYECPYQEHRQVTPETVKRLAETGRFHFMKDTSRDGAACGAKAQAAKGSPLHVFAATLASTPQALTLGADGHCGTVANICPELTQRLCTTKDDAERARLFGDLKSINSLIVDEAYPSSGKYVLEKRGLHLTTVSRWSDTEAFTDTVKRKIDDYLKHFDFQRGRIEGA